MAKDHTLPLFWHPSLRMKITKNLHCYWDQTNWAHLETVFHGHLNHDTVWLPQWLQSVSFPFPSCPTIRVKWRFLHIRPERHHAKFCRTVLTAGGGHEKWGRCLLPNRHSINIDAKNSLQVDWSDVSLPAHCWTNGWQQLLSMGEKPLSDEETWPDQHFDIFGQFFLTIAKLIWCLVQC